MENEAHQKFMKMAIALSLENTVDRVNGPFGAVIVKNGKVIAQSANKVHSRNDPTAHAEIMAIRLACEEIGKPDLKGCVIYTSCEPCPMCMAAIYWSNLESVYYANTETDAGDIGFSDKFIAEELEKSLENRKLSFVQMMRDEANEVFEIWEKIKIMRIEKTPL